MMPFLLRQLWSIIQQDTERKSIIPDSTNSWGCGGTREKMEGMRTHTRSYERQKEENSGQTGASEILQQHVYLAWINSGTGLDGHDPDQDNPEAWTLTHLCHGNRPVPWPGFSLLVPPCSQTQLEGFKHPFVRVGLERWLHRGLYSPWTPCSPWPGRSGVSVTRGGIVTPH